MKLKLGQPNLLNGGFCWNVYGPAGATTIKVDKWHTVQSDQEVWRVEVHPPRSVCTLFPQTFASAEEALPMAQKHADAWGFPERPDDFDYE